MCRVPATVPLMLIYLDLLTKPFSWTFIQTRMWREEEDDDFLARGRRVPRIRSELPLTFYDFVFRCSLS